MNKFAILMLAAALLTPAFGWVRAASAPATGTPPTATTMRPTGPDRRIGRITPSIAAPLRLENPDYSHNMNLSPSMMVLLFSSAAFMAWHNAAPGGESTVGPNRLNGRRHRAYVARSSLE
jgi:hypothetical protein